MSFPTPLVVAWRAWLALLIFWLAAALFANRSRYREPFRWRLLELPPVVLCFYLVFNRHRHFFLYGEFYDTDWQNWIVYLGLLLTFAGVGIAVWARLHLGKYWSGAITLKEGHKVITTGPYRWVRHPIYTGWLAAMLGSAITAGTADAFLGMELVTLALILKLHREEKLLTAEFGDEYRQFIDKVPAAIVPLVSSVGSRSEQTIESGAFNRAALRSDQYRAVGLLCVFAGLAVLDIVLAIFIPADAQFYEAAVAWSCGLAMYEGILLAITLQAQWQGRKVRTWVWAINTAIEGLLPSIGMLGLTADRAYLGPYRALVSSSVLVYCFFIILSTLRLSPGLCILSGFSSAAGYLAVYLFTLHIAPHDRYRHVMPDRTYLLTSVFLFGAGVVAAVVARRIRQHLIAALAEVETRRKLDRIEHDLQTARSIQMGLLPKSPPAVAGYDIAGFSEPADQTGGDYYDWIELPGGRILVIVADAAGHGIGPALLVTACRAYFRAVAAHNDPLERIAEQVDALLAADIPDGRFITAAIALLDPVQNKLSLYSAGHGPMFLFQSAGGRVTAFDADQPPLGIRMFEGGTQARVFNLQPSDALVLLTDGFFEANSPSGELFGGDRVSELIHLHQDLPADKLIARLYGQVQKFCDNVPKLDDWTAVVIKRSK